MKEKISITGVEGIMGTVLRNGLSEKYEITPLGLPAVDVRNYQKLLEIFPGHRAVIHLAWDTDTDNFRSGRINPENSLMFENVYRAAVETDVPLVIMASSVHVDRFYEEDEPLTPASLSHPDSPYGAHKVFMEKLGEWYSRKKGLGVICLRLGGINPEDQPAIIEDSSDKAQQRERSVWLSHRDIVSLIDECLDSGFNKFAIVYAISDNKGRIQDISNPFGWFPKDGIHD